MSPAFCLRKCWAQDCYKSLNKLFRENEKRGLAVRKVFIILIAIDLIVRLLPMKFNPAFGLPMAAIGFIIRAGSIALLYMDIKAAKNNEVKL